MGAFVVMMMTSFLFLYRAVKDDLDLRALLSYTLFSKIAIVPRLHSQSISCTKSGLFNAW